MDVARVSRDAYAEAFRAVTRCPLVALPQLAGASDSEIFFESLALNAPAVGHGKPEDGELLSRYITELAVAFGARAGLLPEQGRMLPGAREALAATARLPGVIQTVLTGTIKRNAVQKLRAFGLEAYLDTEIGGYGSDVYPKGTLIMRSLAMAAEKYRVQTSATGSVYVADSVRDVAAARVGGVRCIGVATGRSTLGELRDAGADLVFTDLSDTSRVIAAIRQ